MAAWTDQGMKQIVAFLRILCILLHVLWRNTLLYWPRYVFTPLHVDELLILLLRLQCSLSGWCETMMTWKVLYRKGCVCVVLQSVQCAWEFARYCSLSWEITATNKSEKSSFLLPFLSVVTCLFYLNFLLELSEFVSKTLYDTVWRIIHELWIYLKLNQRQGQKHSMEAFSTD